MSLAWTQQITQAPPIPGLGNGFVLELLVIFVSAKVFAEVFEQLSLPAALGEILAGIVLGPYASRLVVPSVATHSIAETGAIFLLFRVGLETCILEYSSSHHRRIQ